LIGVQIVLTAAVTCLDYLRLWPGSRPNPPRDWGQFLFVYLASREAPYAALFCALVRKLTRRTRAFAIAVPGVLLLFNLPFLHLIGHPVDAAESLLTGAAHIVIRAFAVRAIRRMRLAPKVGTSSSPSRFRFSTSWSATPQCPAFTAPGAECFPSSVGKHTCKH
jgi:hypothetical protein